MSTSNIEKLPPIIEPSKCIIEDLEILAFETEEQLDFYSIWNELLFDKRKELRAESEHERRVIQNEIARKTSQFICSNLVASASASDPAPPPTTTQQTPKRPSPAKSARTTVIGSGSSRANQQNSNNNVKSRLGAPPQQSILSAYTPKPGTATLSNGLSILNSAFYNTLPNTRHLMKYKHTKLYNKYRGRQMRRNLVMERQRNTRIEEQLSKSHLNTWLAYTALQALRLPPELNQNQLSTVTGMPAPKFLTPMNQPPLLTITNECSGNKKQKISKKSQQKLQQQPNQSQQQQPQFVAQTSQPMQIVYIDPGNLITYSNKINPQQVAEYRRKSHLLPSSASSKKSSAASYDVYEIMEVLANTTKTNVTISRNANRKGDSSNQNSTYTHSVNTNNAGIVSTQLHLQARSYLDSMRKFYAEEREAIQKEEERLRDCPPIEEIINRYIKVPNHV